MPSLRERERGGTACTDGKSVFFDTGFIKKADGSDIGVILAHETAHIEKGDATYVKTILLPLSLANTAVLPFLVINGFLASSPRQVVLSFLLTIAAQGVRGISNHINNLAFRAQERRADRHAARWTTCPLDLAIYFERMAREEAEYMAQRQWKGPKKYSFMWSLLATHPDSRDRIKDLVTLCKRVPEPPAEKLPEFLI